MPNEIYAGHIYPNELLRPPKDNIPSLEHVYFVVGTVMSDIGKGWLSGSIASTLDNPLIIKIDPMLNQSFPENVGIPMDNTHVTDDFKTYQRLGLETKVDNNIVMGQIWREYLSHSQIPMQITEGSIKKQTYADVADYFSDKLLNMIKSSHAKNVVIEIGGTPVDSEQDVLPSTFRLMGIKTNVVPELILLSYFETREDNANDGKKGLKTQIIRQGIRDATTKYAGLPLKSVFVRRRRVSESIVSVSLQDELLRVAYETQISPQKLTLLENYQDVTELMKYISESGIFKEIDKPLMVSACILGIPCRFDGASKPVGDRKMNVILSNGSALILCPEILAGLPTPRGPYNITSGSGEDVLNGIAKVVDNDGNDVTDLFIKGAVATLKALMNRGIKKAYLREGSPSCGINRITTKLDGKVSAMGVTTALLQRWGIECISSDAVV
ncbi:MAG: 2-thiouracil desulfurase family protein [Parcubacteria group bacterium]|jgi:uncharacterized protein YbbK (DUF523 family)